MEAKESQNPKTKCLLRPAGKDAKKGSPKNKSIVKRKGEQEKLKDGTEQMKWVEFACEMVSKEDIRAFNNDLRNKNKDRLLETGSGNSEEEIRNTWEFGKLNGLSGNDAAMRDSLKKLEVLVSDAKCADQELIDDVFL